MSALEATASATPHRDTPPPPVEFRYAQSEGFPALLKQLGASLLVTTYQANKLLVVRAGGAGLSTLVRTYDQAVTVHYATADGSARVGDHDYQARSGTLTFAPGETTKTITIIVHGDSKSESDEWFSVNLSAVSSNSLISNPTGIGWILNDDVKGKKK